MVEEGEEGDSDDRSWLKVGTKGKFPQFPAQAREKERRVTGVHGDLSSSSQANSCMVE